MRRKYIVNVLMPSGDIETFGFYSFNMGLGFILEAQNKFRYAVFSIGEIKLKLRKRVKK